MSDGGWATHELAQARALAIGRSSAAITRGTVDAYVKKNLDKFDPLLEVTDRTLTAPSARRPPIHPEVTDALHSTLPRPRLHRRRLLA